MRNLKVKIKQLNGNAVIPTYAHATDAGMDLVATSKTIDEYGNVVYGTGIALEIISVIHFGINFQGKAKRSFSWIKM